MTPTFEVTARPAVDTAPAPASDVLLVEDDDLVRYALRRLLLGAGRPCLATSSVEEAQQLLAGHEPSLVLTDYNLGGRWTGIDLLLWMRRNARLREIPTVLMTGDDPIEVRARLVAAGLADVEVIAKPFEAPELIELLARLRRVAA
ncbi:MAG TPA: response regulator [Polyangia bacterium]|jgi:CheY-like chemotaxis protein|nr:response regulator [Polyangia bacterium]